jgi:hypothetical protein
MNFPTLVGNAQTHPVPLIHVCLNCGRQHQCYCQKPSGTPCCGTAQRVDCCFDCPCVCVKSN